MTCSSCGTKNRADARFCDRCGQALALEPAATTAGPPTGSKGMSIASLVLGIVATVLLGFLTGIPAVILGAIALAKKRPGKGMAIAGLATGAWGTFVTGGVILALIIPNFVLFQERARRSSVKNNMRIIQTALELYATNHLGDHPGKDVSWESDDQTGMALWLPDGDPTEGIVGSYPLNPYTGERYEYGKDLFYFPDTLNDPGVCAYTRGDDEYCPYRGFAAPSGAGPGTIVILGHTSDDPHERVREYGIIGYGRDVSQPMYDVDRLAPREERNNPDYFIYFVLHS